MQSLDKENSEMEVLSEVDKPMASLAPEAGHDWPTRLLRWLELQGLVLDHGGLKKAFKEDAWWVESHKKVTGPHDLKEVLGKLRDGASSIKIVHDSQAADENAQWWTLHYRPFWLNPIAMLCWRVVLSFVTVLLVLLVLGSIVPSEFRHNLNAAFFPLVAVLLAWQFSARLRPLVEPLKGSIQSESFTSAFSCGLKRCGKAVVILVFSAIAAGVWVSLHLSVPMLLGLGVQAWTQVAAYVSAATSGPVQKSQPVSAPVAAVVAPNPVERPAAPVTSEAPQAASATQAPAAEIAVAQPKEEEVDLNALSQAPAQWPKVVALTKAQSFPVIVGGRAVGSAEVKPGTALKVRAIRGARVTVEFMGSQQVVAAEVTSLVEQVKSARRAASLAPASQAPKQPAAITPTAKAAPAPSGAEAGKPEPTPQQPTTFFGTPQQPTEP